MECLNYEKASNDALIAMQHAGGTDPELLYFFRKALNKLRQKPSIVDNNIQVTLTTSNTDTFLLGDTIEIKYHADFPTQPNQPAVDYWWNQESKEDPREEQNFVQNTFDTTNTYHTPMNSFSPSHMHARQSVNVNDTIVVVRDCLHPGTLESLTLDNIVYRQSVEAGNNTSSVHFDTTVAEFAPKNRHSDKYWVVFLQHGTVPKSRPIPFHVRRGDSTLQVDKILRCGSTTSVHYNRKITKEAALKRMGRKDWIGMYEMKDSSTSNTTTTTTTLTNDVWLHREMLPAPPNNIGNIDFVVPGVPGKFEFRLHSGDAGNAVVAHSEVCEACMRMNAVVGRSKSERDVRIYISSAYGDCSGERKAIADIVEPAVREFCSLISQNVEMTDVRRNKNKKITDSYLSSVMKTSLRDCMASDIFICILGDRYGYVPSIQSMTTRFSTIHPWTCSRTKTNPHVIAGSKNGCGLSLLEMEVQQKFLIPLDMFGPKAVENCIFFFRSPSVKSTEKLNSKFGR